MVLERPRRLLLWLWLRLGCRWRGLVLLRVQLRGRRRREMRGHRRLHCLL